MEDAGLFRVKVLAGQLISDFAGFRRSYLVSWAMSSKTWFEMILQIAGF